MIEWKRFDGMAWPNPYRPGFLDLEDTLRYAPASSLTPEVRTSAASIVAAYRALVQGTRTKRECVVRELRRGGSDGEA